MKTSALLISSVFFTTLSFAQKPEPIMGFAIEFKSIPWYREQAAAWKKEIDKNNQNAYAWYNYYRVNRNLSRLDTTDTRSADEKQKEQKKIVDDMEKAVPNSFEYNLSKWMTGGNDPSYLKYLKKTEELGQGRTEHVSEMINWGEIDRNKARKNEYAQKWYASPMASPGLLYYNYNVISGLKPDAIVLTVGDNDTYPIWLLQSQGIRTDVTVLNLYLLRLDEYREKIFKELGIAKMEIKPSTPVSYGSAAEERYNNEIVKHIAANTKNHPVYVALTVGEQWTNPVAENLYLTGLAYEYSQKSIDNIALLKRNFEQNYALDYIDKPFFHDISDYWVKQTNNNYIVPMLKLYDHYKESGELQQQERIKRKVLLIVKGKPEEKEITHYLAQ